MNLLVPVSAFFFFLSKISKKVSKMFHLICASSELGTVSSVLLSGKVDIRSVKNSTVEPS